MSSFPMPGTANLWVLHRQELLPRPTSHPSLLQVGWLCTIWNVQSLGRSAQQGMVQTSCTWDKNLCRFLLLICIACPLSSFKPSFHSLFKVLFIFPSRYFFAIGLLHIFSLRWSLPPTFRLQSQTALLPDQILSININIISQRKTRPQNYPLPTKLQPFRKKRPQFRSKKVVK